MPRTCIACASPKRKEIDLALASGTGLRKISQRFSVSITGLHRHKRHVAAAIVKAAEAREIKLGDNIFDGIKQLRDKNLDLGSKMEKQGDLRGAVVANKEARECLMAANELAASGSEAKPLRIVVEHIGRRIEPKIIECPVVRPVAREDRLLSVPVVSEQTATRSDTPEVAPATEQADSTASAAPVPAGVTLRNGQPIAHSNGVPLRASPLSVNDRPESFKNGFSPGGMVGISFGPKGRRGRRGRW